MEGLFKTASNMYNKSMSQGEDNAQAVNQLNQTAQTDQADKVDPDIAVKEWNKFTKWLEAKGMRGKPELDKNGLGMQLFNQWRKESNSPFSEDDLPTIRQIYGKIIEDDRKLIAQGKLWMPGANGAIIKDQAGANAKYNEMKVKFYEENEKSANPNYTGKNFTQITIPESYGTNLIKGEFGNMKTDEDLKKSKISGQTGLKVNF